MQAQTQKIKPNLRARLAPVQMHVSAELYLPAPAYRYARIGFLKGPKLKNFSETVIPALILIVEDLQTSTLTSNIPGGLVMITDEAVDYEECCDIQALYQNEEIHHNLDTFGATNLFIAPAIDGVAAPYDENKMQKRFIRIHPRNKTSTHVQQWCSFHPYWWKLVDLGDIHAARIRQAVQNGSFDEDPELGQLLNLFFQTIIVSSEHMKHVFERASPHIFEFEKIQIV